MARGVGLALTRTQQTLRHFSNGRQVLAQLIQRTVTGGPEELTYRTREGVSITIPNEPGARVPIYEILVEDEYRIGWISQGLDADVVALDIGAHVGCFSVAFAQLHRSARVDAYEASGTTAKYLRRNIEANGLSSRVHGRHLAVRAEAGELELVDNAGASGHNGVLHLAEGGPRVKVPAVAMRDVLHVSGRSADLVKIDTEGGEYDMVLGSDPGDWSGVRRVVMEYHDLPGHSWAQLEEFFTEAGLRVVDRRPYADNLGLAWLSRDQLPA